MEDASAMAAEKKLTKTFEGNPLGSKVWTDTSKTEEKVVLEEWVFGKIVELPEISSGGIKQL